MSSFRRSSTCHGGRTLPWTYSSHRPVPRSVARVGYPDEQGRYLCLAASRNISLSFAHLAVRRLTRRFALRLLLLSTDILHRLNKNPNKSGGSGGTRTHKARLKAHPVSNRADYQLSHASILVGSDGVEPPEPYRQRIYSASRYPYGITSRYFFSTISSSFHTRSQPIRTFATPCDQRLPHISQGCVT